MIVRPFDSLSRTLALALSGLAAIIVLASWHSCAVDRAEKRGDNAGYDRALKVAVASQPKLVDTVRIHTRVTDISLAAASTKATTVAAVAERVPQIVRDTIPIVDTLVVESQALAATVTTLRGDVLTERSAREQLQTATALLVVAKQDSIRFLEKRPTKTRAALYGIVALGMGFILGKH